MKKALGLGKANADDSDSQNSENQFDDNPGKKGGKDTKK